MRHRRTVRRALRGVVLSCTCALVACSLVLPFDELGGGTRPSPVDAAEEAQGDAPLPELDAGVDAVPQNVGGGRGIFSLRLTEVDGSITSAPVRLEIDGSVSVLGCESAPYEIPEGGPVDLGGSNPYFLGTHYDPNDLSRALFVYSNPAGASGAIDAGSVPLFLATESTSCSDADAPRALIDGTFAVGASFSPDGERVALVLGSNEAVFTKLVTFNTKGPPLQKVIRNLAAFSDAGATSIQIARPSLFPAPGGYVVYWAESSSDGRNVIRSHIDSNPEVPPAAREDDDPALLSCASSRGSIRQFGILPLFGRSAALVVVLAAPSGGFTGKPRIYWGDRGDTCDSLSLLFDDEPAALSNDFAASPDGRFLAHTSTRGTADGGTPRWAVWMGSKEVGQRAVRVQCSRPPVGANDRGTYWIERGARVTWTRETAGEPSVVMVADVKDGVCSNERVVGRSTTTVGYITARTGTCSMGRRGGDGGAVTMTLFGVALALSVRRRRRRSAS
jgi:hypothetical protein